MLSGRLPGVPEETSALLRRDPCKSAQDFAARWVTNECRVALTGVAILADPNEAELAYDLLGFPEKKESALVEMPDPASPDQAVAAYGPKVLVVDDDAAVRQMVEDVLESEGFTVAQAASGVHLAEIARREQPDVVVLDQIMAPVSGTEALRALRSAGETVPVLILTGVPSENLIEVALELGADDFLAKPFSGPVLIAHLRAILRRSQWQVRTDDK